MNRDYKSNQFKLFGLAGIVIAVLLANSWFIYQNFKYVSEQQTLAKDTSLIIEKLELLISAAKDSETGVRGYILTNQTNFLKPYEWGERDSQIYVDELKKLLGTDVRHIADLRILERLTNERLEILRTMLDEFRAQPSQVGKRNEYLEKGKSAMDALRAHVNRMKQNQRSILAERDEITDRSKSVFNWILILTTVLSSFVIFGAFIQLIRSQNRILEDSRARNIEAQEKALVADLAQLLTGDISAQKVGQLALGFLSRNFGTLAGRIFMNDGAKIINLASMGVEDDNFQDASSFTFENSLVATALARKDLWEIPNIPSDYWNIKTSLGQAKPSTLLFVPFEFQGRALGVVELAGFESFATHQLKAITQLREPIGIALSAAFSRDLLQDLLTKSQLQSEELQAQQEELQTNNEELEQQARALENEQETVLSKNNELQEIQKVLLEQADELKKSSQYKSDFLAKMSHELRTPLNGLLILSTLLLENKEGTLTPKQQDFARSISGAGNDLLVLINDILDLSKIEARKLSIRTSEFSLHSLLESKKMTFNPQIVAKNLEFFIEVDKETEKLNLNTDRQRLEQILRNFLSNAIKFTDAGKITLQVKTNSAKDRIIFTVKDTGIGIPKDLQKVIFGAFEQGDSSISRRFGGTGLGLTISQELASLLGGEIYLESTVDKGSSFTLDIPLSFSGSLTPIESIDQKLAQSMVDLKNLQEKRPFASDLSEETFDSKALEMRDRALENIQADKKTILIVEDNENFRKTVADTVQTYGYQPIETGDGEVAVAILNKHVPDAILLDIKLPGISGLGILELIKQMPHLRHVPVHIISGLEYHQNALRMGALGYLNKPVTKEKIVSALDRIENVISKNLRKVLLIEDDERQLKAISELISDESIEVISVRTGKEAVALLKITPIDCIILDLTLPDISGFDIIPELTKMAISIPPLIVYTGKDLTEEEDTFLRKYSESIVIKGARSPERLLDEVNLFLHRVESLMPLEKQRMLSSLRSREKMFEGKTVLLVDDDIRNIFALTSALENRGLQIRVARNGLEALDQVGQHKDIDLVLMDIMMPKMDGFQAIQHIRSHSEKRIRELPVVALTAKAMREDHEKCIAAGASDYLSKPINIDNLTTVLKVWLSNKGFIS